jgi:hypothetical protein
MVYPGLRVSDRASLATASDADREMNRWLGPLLPRRPPRSRRSLGSPRCWRSLRSRCPRDERSARRRSGRSGSGSDQGRWSAPWRRRG